MGSIDKGDSMKTIALIGFMGAGKTVISKILAEKLGFQRVSTDEKIVEAEQCSINEIFAQKGEEYFRQVESRVVEQVAQQPETIIDCGGGVVLNPDNVTALKKNGCIYYLKASAGSLYESVKHCSNRPLLKVDDPQARIVELLQAREPFYSQADHILETDGLTPQEVADQLYSLISAD